MMGADDVESLLPRHPGGGTVPRAGGSLRTVTTTVRLAIVFIVAVVLGMSLYAKHSEVDVIERFARPPWFAPQAATPVEDAGLLGNWTSPTNETEEAIAEVSEILPEPEPEPPSRFNSSKLALLLENRDIPEIETMVFDFITKVPDDWPFRVFCGEANEQRLLKNRLLAPHLESGKLTVTPLPDETQVHGKVALSVFMTDSWLWEAVAPAENIFVFQTDSVICSRAETSLDDWLGFVSVPGGYAWLGAPWAFAPGRRVGGNGGFSLRRRSYMLNITTTYDYEPGVPEDLWFARILERDFNSVLPTFQKALTFAFENPPRETWRSEATFKTLGVHVGSYWSQCPYPENVRRVLEYCPDARQIIAPECIPL